MHVCANLGKPYLEESPGSPLARKIESMAAALAGTPVRSEASRPFWKRLLGTGG
jgi:Flp pilus assembly CpaE family ATPase